MANSFKEINFKAKARAVDLAFKEAIQIIAKDAVVTFKHNFDLQGFVDESLQSWKPRKNQIRSMGASVRGGLINTKKTLTKTGALKRSIRYLSGIRGYSATVISDLPYSQIHNEGLRGNAWGRHNFQMPKRKFMGRSSRLERLSFAKIQAKINTAFRNA